MAEGGEDWELCKENIQPLKQGRAMSSLQAALQGKDTVQQRRRNFEEELRTYSGEDPLDVWHRWADISSEPEVVFKAMYDRSVGAGLAPFYVRWANHREAVGDSKNAAKILRKGISRKACPKETLEAQLRHLEARVSRQVAQQMMEMGEEAVTTEDGRSVLATLKQVGRRGQVGTERASQRVEVQGGVGGQAPGHAGGRAPRVLSRENPEGDDNVFVRPAAPAPFVVAAEGAKENASRPGKWTSAKMLAKEKEQERLEREAAKDREVQSLRLQVEQMRNELAEMRRLFVQNR
ncbi:unnamed protein product [Ixodes pacificus]